MSSLGLADQTERVLVRALQAVLVAVVAYGLSRGEIGLVVNAGVSLAISVLPAYLRRDTSLSLDAGLTLWLTAAVVLHAFGTVGLYRAIPIYDQVAHALSASVVAAAGYATIRALEIHSDAVSFPDGFRFLLLFLTVMAFGVLWEILEFATSLVSQLLGGQPVLAQYGLDDIVWDLVFNQVGAVVVGLWGTSRVSGLTRSLAGAMERRGDGDAGRGGGRREGDRERNRE